MTKLTVDLIATGLAEKACADAMLWLDNQILEYGTIQGCWQMCHRGDWMLWLLSSILPREDDDLPGQVLNDLLQAIFDAAPEKDDLSFDAHWWHDRAYSAIWQVFQIMWEIGKNASGHDYSTKAEARIQATAISFLEKVADLCRQHYPDIDVYFAEHWQELQS